MTIDRENEFNRYLRRCGIRREADRFMRPDAARYLRPDWERYFRPSLDESKQASFEDHAQDDGQIHWESETERLRFRAQLASLRFELAMLRLSMRASKALHHSNFQPRVPAGNTDGGQFTEGAAGGGQRTRVAGPLSVGRGGRYGVNFPGVTQGQMVQLDQAVARTARALDQIRQYDRTWQPRTTSAQVSNSTDGAIRHAEARALEAETRLDLLRSGIGGNRGPSFAPNTPQPGLDPPRPRAFDGPSWIGLYRAAHNMPDLFGHPTWPSDKGTVAVADVDGKIYVGINSDAPGYESADRIGATRMRDSLIAKYPHILDSENSGRIPNDSFFHAESTILMRLARDNNWTLTGRSIEVQTDRDLCHGCNIALPLLGNNLGNPTVIFRNGQTGRTWLLQNGAIRDVR